MCFTKEYKAIWKENLAVYQKSLRAFSRHSFRQSKMPNPQKVSTKLNIFSFNIISICGWGGGGGEGERERVPHALVNKGIFTLSFSVVSFSLQCIDSFTVLALLYE